MISSAPEYHETRETLWEAGRTSEQNYKTDLSSDCRLKLAYMKLELLVIANQNVAVNTFPGLVHTARHTMRVGNTQSS